MKTMIQVVDLSKKNGRCWIAADSIQEIDEQYPNFCRITTAHGTYTVAESIWELAERAELKLKKL